MVSTWSAALGLLLIGGSARIARAEDETVDLSVGASVEEHSAMRALVMLRAERSLAAAREAYTASVFEECEAELLRTERDLRSVIEATEDLHQIKRVLQWLGLCQAAAGNEAAAGRSFALCATLPGPPPDRSLFPPQILRLYQRKTRSQSRCSLVLGSALPRVWIDGRWVEPKGEISIGEHYVRSESARQAERIEIAEDCRLMLPKPAPVEIVRLTQEEAASAPFLSSIAERSNLRRLRLVHPGHGSSVLFDRESGTFTRTSSDAAARSITDGSNVSIEVEPAESPADLWWLWLIVGVAAASAIIVPTMLLTRSDEPAIITPPPDHEPSYSIGF